MCILAGIVLQIAISADLDSMAGWLLGLALANTRRAIVPSVQRGLLWITNTKLAKAVILVILIPPALLVVLLWVLHGAALRLLPSNMSVARAKSRQTIPRLQISAARWLKHAVVYGTMPAIFIWFALSQARIASPDEAACEVRWNWDLAMKFSEPQASDEGLVPQDDQSADPTDYAGKIGAWNKERGIASRAHWHLSVDQILLPLMLQSHVHCLTDNGPQISDKPR